MLPAGNVTTSPWGTRTAVQSRSRRTGSLLREYMSGPGRVGSRSGGSLPRGLPVHPGWWRRAALQGRHCIAARSEEHTSELQSLMRISYAVFCLKKKNKQHITHYYNTNTYDIHNHATS